MRMSYEMRRLQDRVMFHKRVESGDRRQIKRQMRTMVKGAVQCAINSNRYVDWALVVEYRRALSRARQLAKRNKALRASRWTVGSIAVATGGGNSVVFKTYERA